MSAPANHCTWSQDDEGHWETSCKRMFSFSADGPAENEFAFCCFCGKPLHPVPYDEVGP